MAIFENCSVLLELKNLPFKEKKKVKLAVTENGGALSFVVNKQCSLIVTTDVSSLSSNRLRSIQKYQTPVVGVDYVHCCVAKGFLLPVEAYQLSTSSPSSFPPPLPISSATSVPLPYQATKVPRSQAAPEQSKGQAKPLDSIGASKKPDIQERHPENDQDLPSDPDDFQVAKYSIFQKPNSSAWCVVELQSFKRESGMRYCVVRCWKDDVGSEEAPVRDISEWRTTSEKALKVYQELTDDQKNGGLEPKSSLPEVALNLASAPLQQLLLEEKLNTASLSQEVGVFVELLCEEADCCLNTVLQIPPDDFSINDVTRAEGLLLQAQRKMKEANNAEVVSLLEEVYVLLPHTEPCPPPSAKLISQKLDICQLLRDVLNVKEMALRNDSFSCLGRYRALRCSVETVPPAGSDFQAVAALLQDSKVQIQQVLRVSRGVELQTFKSKLGNIKPLLHSSGPSNFLGILSRGLLLPHVGVEYHGIERTDVGNLGSGIYFSNSLSTSLKYSKPCVVDGSRLLLVCDVALGQCKDVQKKDLTLTRAPEGYHSVHGVRATHKTRTDFEDDEFVVYSPDQVKLKYVVQFSIDGDQLKEFSPDIDTSAEPCPLSSDQVLPSHEDGVESCKNPLDDVSAGLMDSSGQQLPLQAVNVKCKLMDLLSQVIIFQKYTNQSSVPIEAKYVFPLDDSAAVCGFEAFINGKHVVGQVEEKEKARKEYKKAIEKGHGAYLMDQDAPDVFTISVGNLPPGATVLIKVTFVSELIIKDGSVFFFLPGSVAPWQQSAALNQTTQVTVEKVRVTDQDASTREFTLDMSIEMPYEITDLQCITHKVKMKRTDCKAVVSVLPGEVMGPDGFQLSITLTEIHLPRMWVEKHPDKDSQACMLVFYPEFDVSSTSTSDEVIFLLDTSGSMNGKNFHDARRIALEVLKALDDTVRVNVIFFSTDYTEAFLKAERLDKSFQAAKNFIKSSPVVQANTELWRPLRALSLLPPSYGVRNLLLLSDGHIQNVELTLQLLRDNVQHTRLFTCGLSPTANRHMLRALAQAGGGAYEFFDTKTKHNWVEKVTRQVKRMASPCCSSVSVKWQQFNPAAPTPVQAPKQLHALFNDCHTLVYGFVPHCTQATLLGNLNGHELETMLSTTELQKTKGTFLHKLTARAIIRDYEDGSLDADEAEHEGKKAELKSFIIKLSKEFSILSQFTSFVAIEERDSKEAEEGFTDIPKLVAEEDVDFLPYISWVSPQDEEEVLQYVGMAMPISESDSEESEEMEDHMYDCLIAPEFQALRMKCARVEEGLDVTASSSSSSSWIDSADSEEMDTCADVVATHRLSSVTKGYRLYSGVMEGDMAGVMEGDMAGDVVTPICLGMGSFGAPDYEDISFAISADATPKSEDKVYKKAPRSPVKRKQMALRVPAPPPSAPVQDEESAPPPPPPLPSAPVQDEKSAPPPPQSAPVQDEKSAPPPPQSAPVQDEESAPPPPPPPAPRRFAHLSALPTKSRLRSLGAPPFWFSRGLQQQTQSLRPEGAFQFGQAERRHRRIAFGQAAAVERDAWIPAANQPPRPLLSAIAGASCVPASAAGALFSFGEEGSSLFGVRSRVLAAASSSEGVTGYSHGMSPGQTFEEAPAAVPASAGPGPAGPPQEPMELKTLAAMTETFEEDDQDDILVARRKPAPERFVCRGGRSMKRRLMKYVRESPPDRIEEKKVKWDKIFQMQHSEGYWELTTDLGELINVDVDSFANVFLKNKGICSLGVRAHANILRLVATLLVLQLMRLEKLEEGKVLRTLFCLKESSEPRAERWEAVRKAVVWVSWADRQYPCVYSRLEFGWSWEASTRQLLGYDELPALSPLRSLSLQNTAKLLLVH